MSLSPGDITVSNTYKAMYAARFINVAPNGAINDLFYIAGSSTKTIRINRIGIVGTNNVADTTKEIFLVKRSTADTGGSTAATIALYSSSNPAATTTLVSQPSGTGTLVGIIRSTKFKVPVTTPTGAAQSEYTWYFNTPSQELVLRGANEVVAVNFNGITITGNSFSFWIEWTEE